MPLHFSPKRQCGKLDTDELLIMIGTPEMFLQHTFSLLKAWKNVSLGRCL